MIVLLGGQAGAKFVGVWPLARAFRLPPREANYTTLMMATGLTFGTISALFGLENHYIDQTQYTVLVTVVIGSAVVPTIVAQTFFQPQVEPGPVETPAPEAEAHARAGARHGR